MGNFLVLIPPAGAEEQAGKLFDAGLAVARSAKNQSPSGSVRSKWAYAASFFREDGSGSAVYVEPAGKGWLLASGTWFHISENYGPGNEQKLFERYLEVGAERLAHELEGMFAILIGDAKEQSVSVITDINGSCHAFIASIKGATAISGSSFLLACLTGGELDPVGCQEFLCNGVSYEERTLYRQVQKLRPAGYWRYRAGKLAQHHHYWRISDEEPESLDGDEAVNEVWKAMTAASRRFAESFPKPVCDLTGGYDSRAIVAALVGAHVPFSTQVSGPPDSPDVTISKKIADSLKVDHRYLAPTGVTSFAEAKQAFAQTDGEFDLIEYAWIARVQRSLLGEFDLSINGSFGGIARALWWEILYPSIGARQKLDSEKLARTRYAAAPFDQSIFPLEVRIDFGQHFTGVIDRINDGLANLPNTTQMDNANLQMRIHRWQGRIASSTNQIRPCVSMFGLKSVLSPVLRTKAAFRLKSNLVRHMLGKYSADLAKFPTDRGYPAEPLQVTNLHRFWPMVPYMSGRIVSKARRTVGIGIARKVGAAEPGRLQLLKELEVRELLDARVMAAGDVLDRAALTDFLNRARATDFKYEGQWNRLLTLEWTLRTLREHRFEPSESAVGKSA